MSNLTEQQIEYVSQIVNKSKIKSQEMKEDLIDHFCCAIEEEMEKGLDFEKSYDKAYQSICPEGFDEIQRETVFLLTFKKLKAMKQFMYLSGYLSAIGVTTTFFLKLNHLAGGLIVLLVTAAILSFLFLPSLFINLYKRELTKTIIDKLKYIFGFLGAVLLIVSVVFKIAHWPYATMIFLTHIAAIHP